MLRLDHLLPLNSLSVECLCVLLQQNPESQHRREEGQPYPECPAKKPEVRSHGAVIYNSWANIYWLFKELKESVILLIKWYFILIYELCFEIL